VASNITQDQLTQILETLHRLETRINRIEEYLEIQPERIAGSEIRTAPNGKKATAENNPLTPFSKGELNESLEFKIGEYWLAHLGTVVLLMGIAFFLSYPFTNFPAILVSLLGYLAVGVIVGLSHYWQKTYPYLAKILFVGGLVLLYFAALRMHFFNPNPVLTNKIVALAAVAAVLAGMFYIATKRNSELLTGSRCFLVLRRA
jgi:drug/metabolite transporter (DMT)-like permease